MTLAQLKVVNTWGIGNFRQTAGFPYMKNGKYQYVCPLGSCIVVWDIEKRIIVKSIQIHPDAIVCLLKCDAKDLVLSLSYSGEGKLLTDDLKCIRKFHLPSGNVVYACWSNDGGNFCVCTTGPLSAVYLYKQSNDGMQNTLLWSKPASDSQPPQQEEMNLPFVQKNDDNMDKQNCKNINCSDTVEDLPTHPLSSTNDKKGTWKCYYGCAFTNSNTIFTVFKQNDSPCEAHLFNKTGEILARKILSPLGDQDASMVCMSSCHKNKIAVGLRRGIFLFIDCSSLEITSVFQTQGSAQVCLWDDETLLTASYQNGKLQWWDDSGVLLKEFSISPIESVIHLNWSIPGKELWIGAIPSLNYVFIEDKSKTCSQMSLVQHRVAGCGLSFKNCDSVASGDLAGNVIISNVSENMDLSHPGKEINITSPVRSLCWLEEFLLIGTLNGELFCWKPIDNYATKQKLLFHFKNSVLTIRKSNTNNTIAVGTGSGKLYVFNFHGGDLEMKLDIQAHDPRLANLETELRPMEIWSVAWNPSDRFLATASEDMTSVILDAKDGHLIAKLTGHTTAVTSVDWKTTRDKCILATCADDRTVRIYDGITFALIKVLGTLSIEGWYTLTYLAINPIQNLILCSTQNGFLVGWDCTTMECVMSWRIHSGSIEGLEWDKAFKTFATVGSDCVVNVLKIENA